MVNWSEPGETAPPVGPKLKVFTFGDDAYQVDARARFALLPDRTRMVKVDGRTARAIVESERSSVQMYHHASRLSGAAEWFELALRKAVHDYLDAEIDAGKKALGGDGEVSDIDAWMSIGNARRELTRCAERGYVTGNWHPESYFGRVFADIDARLRGEPGEVQRP